MKMKLRTIIMLVALMGIGSCGRDKDSNQGNFDRKEMLSNYINNLIEPSYSNVQFAVNQLDQSLKSFRNEISIARLNALQQAWINAYEVWQYASVYNIGPAAEQGVNRSLREEIATFPISVSKIDQAISTGQYNMNDFNRDARGFLALEYLLFGGVDVSDQMIINRILNEDYMLLFMSDCVANIKSRIDQVVKGWTVGNMFDFVENDGTDVGSSTSQLYNEFVKAFETNKNFKIELPLGKRPGQTQVEPQLVEAYYSGMSLHFLKIHLQVIENIYIGRDKNGRIGASFKDYLQSVNGGQNLVESTLNQWDVVKNTLSLIPENQPLSVQIVNNPQPIENLGIELQRHTRFFKSDMSSLLGIAITFSSGDGD